MAILDAISDIADRRTATATSMRAGKHGTGVSAGGSPNDVPVLVRTPHSVRHAPEIHQAAHQHEKSDTQGTKAVTRSIDRKPDGPLRRLLFSIGRAAQQRKNKQRNPERQGKVRSSDAAASGMDNFIAGKADTDPGARKPKIAYPARNGRSLSLQTREEREDRLSNMFAFALFQKLDVNGDGVLSWEELRPLRDVIGFDKFDANGDGCVSWREFNRNYEHIRSAARNEIQRRKDRDTHPVRTPALEEPRQRTREAALER